MFSSFVGTQSWTGARAFMTDIMDAGLDCRKMVFYVRERPILGEDDTQGFYYLLISEVMLALLISDVLLSLLISEVLLGLLISEVLLGLLISKVMLGLLTLNKVILNFLMSYLQYK